MIQPTRGSRGVGDRGQTGPPPGKPQFIQVFSLCIDIVLICFHIVVLREYWALTKNRKLLKLVLGEVRIVALSINSHEQTQ